MTSAKHFSRRKLNGYQLDHSGITEHAVCWWESRLGVATQSLGFGVAVRSRPMTQNPNSFEISGEEGRNSLTSVFGKFDFHCLSLSLFVASSFAASRGLFTHSRVHDKTTIEQSQQDLQTASGAVFIRANFCMVRL